MQQSLLLVDDLMSEHPIWVKGTMLSHEALAFARAEGVHYLLVGDNSELRCITCLCDISRAGVGEQVGSFAHSGVLSVQSGAPADSAAMIMRGCAIGCLPVLGDSGEVRGVITRSDLRGAGLIKEELGDTQCASCGSTHSLSRDGDGVVFCRDCLESTPEPGTIERRWYCALGGGD